MIKINPYIILLCIIGILIFVAIYGYINQEESCCKKIADKELRGYNGTRYGGYNCYEKKDYLDVYFSPSIIKNNTLYLEGDITYFYRCYDDMDYCFIMKKYQEVR